MPPTLMHAVGMQPHQRCSKCFIGFCLVVCTHYMPEACPYRWVAFSPALVWCPHYFSTERQIPLFCGEEFENVLAFLGIAEGFAYIAGEFDAVVPFAQLRDAAAGEFDYDV